MYAIRSYYVPAREPPGASFRFFQALDQEQAAQIIQDRGTAAGFGAEGRIGHGPQSKAVLLPGQVFNQGLSGSGHRLTWRKRAEGG